MGWKLQAGILLAIAAGLVLFRKQLGGLFTEAGGAVGESIGGFFGGIPTGIQTGAAQAVAPWWGGLGEFLTGGGLVGQYFKEQGSKKQEQIIIGGSQPNLTDLTITPYNRELIAKFEASSRPTAVFAAQAAKAGISPEMFRTWAEQFAAVYPTVTGGHAEKTITAKAISGGISPLEYFRSLQLQGFSRMQARAKMREVFGVPS